MSAGLLQNLLRVRAASDSHGSYSTMLENRKAVSKLALSWCLAVGNDLGNSDALCIDHSRGNLEEQKSIMALR